MVVAALRGAGEMNHTRLLKHLLRPAWWYRRLFDGGTRAAIEVTIKESERHHRGELRFVAEGPLPWRTLWAGATARQRAEDLFAQLRVWDTADNSGILIYVQLADRQVEIVADRGITARVSQTEWDMLCRGMEAAFRAGKWRDGALSALAGASALLALHFPASEHNPNELPDRPLIL